MQSRIISFFEVFSQKKIGDFDPKYCYVMAKIDQGF
jgi:hypothetical protein